MRVAIVGGTGFIGSYLIEGLLDAGHSPVVLVRPGSEHKVSRADQCEIVRGDLQSVDDLTRLVRHCDCAVFLVGILRERPADGITFEALQFEAAAKLIDAAAAGGVSRLLLMSANGVEEQCTDYQTTKYRAERHAFASDLDVTVFRPSVVFGDPRGRSEFATQLLNDMILPPIPAVGFFNAFGARRGTIDMAPVHVADVVGAFLAALEQPQTVGQSLTLVGPERLTWQAMLERIANTLNRGKWIVPMPIELMKVAATLLDWIPAFPVTRDQLTMLAESNVGDPAALTRLLGRDLRAFDSANLSYLAS